MRHQPPTRCPAPAGLEKLTLKEWIRWPLNDHLELGASMMKTFYASMCGAIILFAALIPPAITIIDSIGL